MPGPELPLRELQRRFFSLITAPEDVASSLAAHGLSAGELERMIRSDERRSAVERLDIYANMYFFRIRDVLAEMYPRLAALVGEAPFHNLVTDYLVAHPSSHPSLRNVGSRLAPFLDEHGDQERPWLADLARLESARHEVFDAADAEPLELEALRTLPPEKFASLPLALIPALQRTPVRFAVEELWSDAGAGAGSAPPAGQPGELLVWRPRCDAEVLHRRLDEREAAALSLLPAPFGVVCDWLSAQLPEEQAAPAAFSLLAQWANDRLLVHP